MINWSHQSSPTCFGRIYWTPRLARGAHGFVVALTDVRAGPDAITRVRVAGRVVELDNSGQCLVSYQIAPAC